MDNFIICPSCMQPLESPSPSCPHCGKAMDLEFNFSAYFLDDTPSTVSGIYPGLSFTVDENGFAKLENAFARHSD